ncbi:ABC transporter permease [Oribacterium sp. oral taxon 102]|nr:ABC transporter permease [Oribacterium sp. oral taxon 102]
MRRQSALKSKHSGFLALPYLVWMTGFIVIPLLLVLYYGFTDRNGAFTLANIAEILVWENYRPLYLALGLSAASTLLCLLLAFPLALILRNRKLGKGSFVAFIFILPMWMNSLLRILAWQTLLERKGVINGILTALHLPNQHLINTPGAIVLGMVYDFLPFMILPIYNSLIKIDDNTINAAYDLGASFFTTLWRILVPLSVPGIVSGVTMVFVPTLTTFAISNMLGGGKIFLIGNVIEQEFTVNSDWNLGSGLSMVLMLFIVLSMAVLSKYDDGEGAMF